jgi:murein L,D-transpeptidase YcbB/YkuD
VNQLHLRCRTGLLAALVFAGLVFAGLVSGVGAMAQSASTGATVLNAEDQAWLHQAVDSGNSPDLRWPNFSDYSQHLKKFYGFNGYSLWWVKNGEPTVQAMQVIAALRQAELKGLTAEDYDGSRWDGRLAKLKPTTRQPAEADAVKFDLDLTVCVMRYISDLHIGKVNPKHLDFAFDEESKKYDLPEFLRDRVVSGGDVAGVLATVEPPYPGYRRTIQALQTYIELAKKDNGEQLPAVKKPIVPGDTYAGVPRVAQLLRLVGDLPQSADVSAGSPTDPPIYKGALVDAVKNFQRRLGRDVTGRIDAQTVADLNVPLSSRVRQMQLTLERWRWLPASYQNAPIIANIPEFRLRAYDKDFNVGVTMNVVVGKAYGHGTPVFSENMQYVVFRPYWEVPYSITKAEIVPHILRDPGYLARENREIVDSKQNVVASGAVSSDAIDQLRAGKLFVRQKPGPKNSLGLVKFLFPNSYNVYMHDTPATELFSRSRRDFSHGCVRLEKPAELAAWVLRDNPGWTPERIHDAMNGTTTQQVNLTHPIPVLIVYATVIVLEDGQVHFYDDIYGHDTELEKALAQGYPYPW